MNVVITQLTPVGVSPNWCAIAGVETLKTVSFRTPKKTRKMIHGTVPRTSRVWTATASGAAWSVRRLWWAILLVALTAPGAALAQAQCAPTTQPPTLCSDRQICCRRSPRC